MIRKARLNDVNAIKELLDGFAAKQLLLSRSIVDIISCLRDFLVFEEKEKIAGCVALHLDWFDLAEIRSLAVAESMQGNGLGKQLVQAALEEAKTLGIKRVFTLTKQQDFFKKNSFFEIDKAKLPQKVWGDCVNCPKFTNCDEIAMETMV